MVNMQREFSNKIYTIKHNEVYDILVTQPVPDNLEAYYNSEDYISHTDASKSILDKSYQAVKKST